MYACCSCLTRWPLQLTSSAPVPQEENEHHPKNLQNHKPMNTKQSLTQQCSWSLSYTRPIFCNLDMPGNSMLLVQCLLDNLLQSKDENGEGLSMQSLRDQLMTLLVAGQETSAILLGWTTAFLAQYPEVQALAAAEVQQVLQGQSPTPDSIK